MPVVALVGCAVFPQLDEDDRLVLPELDRLGVEVEPVVWNDPGVDWSAYDLVVLRETWDYPERRAEFIQWLTHVSGVTTLLNPADVVEWNTDKRYLRDLADVGVPIVATRFIEPHDEVEVLRADPGYADFVVKPAVSAGSRDTVRYASDGPLDDALAHVSRLQGAGRTVMVQPYLDAIDANGETAILFIGGTYSHAIRKAPILVRGVEGQLVEGLFAQERIERRTPSDTQLSVARQVIAAIPGGADRILYARVDLIDDADRMPQLLELELTEPSLFLAHDDDAPTRLAQAIAARLARESI